MSVRELAPSPLARAIAEVERMATDRRRAGKRSAAEACDQVVTALRELAATVDTDRLHVVKCPQCGSVVDVRRHRRRHTPG